MNVGWSAIVTPWPVGGGGRSLTGFSSNVTSPIVMSSEMLMSVEMTGTAGRAICSGGGGISNSWSTSICWIDWSAIDMSSGVISGKSAISPKWRSAAAKSEPQNHLLNPFLRRSFALGST